MALNSSGPISFGGSTVGQSINLELGVSATALASINSTSFRTLAGVASGQISLSNFYGKSNTTYYIGAVGISGSSIDVVGGGISDSSGNVYYGGTIGNQAAVFKFNSSGAIQWATILNGSAGRAGRCNDVCVDSSGNVYAVGDVVPSGTYTQFFIWKLNSSGVVQWQQSTDIGGAAAEAQSICTDNTNVWICGGVQNAYSFSVMKYDTSGTLIWYSRWQNQSTAQSIKTDGAGNVYVSGLTFSGNWGFYKIDSSGNFVFMRWLNGQGAQAFGVALGTDNSVHISGYVNGGISGTTDMFVVKYSSAGVFQWNKVLGTTFATRADDITVDSSNNVYICGFDSTNYSKGIVAKYNSSGTLQWQRTIAISNTTNTFIQLNAIKFNSQGLINVGGTGYVKYGTGPGGTYYALKTDGSNTGTYTLNTATYTIAASSLTEATPSYSYTSSTPAQNTGVASVTRSNSSSSSSPSNSVLVI